MARKSKGGSALPKYRGGRRVKGKEVSDKLPPVKKYRDLQLAIRIRGTKV